MKYITYKNHSEYNEDDLRTLLDPSSEFKIVNLSEENNSVDLLYNAPRFGVLLDNNDGNPVTVNDDKLKVFINKEINDPEDYNTLPAEEYYLIDSLYILKNSGYNKNKENMHEIIVKYPGYQARGVENFDDIPENFILPLEDDEFNCQIHMNWSARGENNIGTSDIDTHVFVYKKDENGNLIYQGGHIYYPEDSQKFYVKDDAGNIKVQVNLSWDDTTSEGSESCRKGEYIKIKQNKNYCSDEEYAKYYFVYCLHIWSYDDSWTSQYKLDIWNDVTINVTNNAGIVKPYYPKATTETANRVWCGLLINNNNVLSSADEFAYELETPISSLEFLVTPTLQRPSIPGRPGAGGGVAGIPYSIILPEFTDELPEMPSKE